MSLSFFLEYIRKKNARGVLLRQKERYISPHIEDMRNVCIFLLYFRSTSEVSIVNRLSHKSLASLVYREIFICQEVWKTTQSPYQNPLLLIHTEYSKEKEKSKKTASFGGGFLILFFTERLLSIDFHLC